MDPNEGLSDMNPSLRDDHIAIVGLGCRFPGAQEPGQFWDNLINGVESITELTEDHLREAGVPESWIRDPKHVKAAPLIEDMEGFDARLFGFTPREAQIQDPQHRIFLETCHAALENAGCDPARFPGSIGVYGGAANDFYGEQHVKRNREVMRSTGGMSVDVANHPDYLTTTVSYRLGLQGPSVNVQTACSTSLVAVHLAAQALRAGECDLALAGGVEVNLPYGKGHFWEEGGIYSPDGHCRSFDAKANGTIFGAGVGVVALKRLGDAREAGDHVYAIIRGSAVNNDGAARGSFTAPGVEGQTKLVLEALAAADVDPEDISYLEAHGTGTLVGDPIEVNGLTNAFRQAGATAKQFCAIGSVKANVGHLGPAAGAAGLIKVCLALQAGELPPSINYDTPNPSIDFANSPFAVQTTRQPWPRGDAPRVAGVSSFGIGGTNAHVIVEEAPADVATKPRRMDRPWRIVPVSAKTPTALDASAKRIGEHLRRHPDLHLSDVSATLADGRTRLPYRKAVVANEAADAAGALGAAKGSQIAVSASPARKRRIGFMFSGQGAQHPEMGRGLYDTYAVYRAAVDECCAVLEPILGTDLRTVIMPAPGDADRAAEELKPTRMAQPALFVVEYAGARLLDSWGIRPDVMIGHSIGEYVAAHLSGVFSLEDALRLVVRRGELMQSMPPGTMVAVPVVADALRPLLYGDLEIAAENAPTVTVVAGPTDAVEEFVEALSFQSIEVRRLHTSHAFHSAMMDPILEPFEQAVATLTLNPPTGRFISNVTGTWITDEEATDPAYWARHLRSTVKFAAGLETLAAEDDLVLLEVGPGENLSLLARMVVGHLGLPITPSMRHPLKETDDSAVILGAIAKLWVAGVEPDWAALNTAPDIRRIPLPGYAYERTRFWIEPDEQTATADDEDMPEEGVLPIEDAMYTPVWHEEPLSELSVAEPDDAAWLILSPGEGVIEELATAVRARGNPVFVAIPGPEFAQLAADRFMVRPGIRADMQALLDRCGEKVPPRVVHGWTATPAVADPLDMAEVERMTELGFHSLLALAQEIDRRLPEEPVSLFVVSANMQDVTGGEDLEPAKATVLGPSRTINRELSTVVSRSIDLSLPAAVPVRAQVEQLLAECRVSSGSQVTAWRGHRRWAWSFRNTRLKRPDGKPLAIKDRGVYLITGGLGGLGLTVARHLAEVAKARLVLLARSAFPAEEEWTALLADENTTDRLRQQLQTLSAIRDGGGEVLICQGDVADEVVLRSVAARAAARFGAIDGIFHTAGVAGGGMLSVRTRDESERTMSPKIAGTVALLRVFGDDIDFLSLFSSISAVAAEFGLVDYCAANNFQDAVARRLSNRGRAVHAIGWAAWKEVGMAHNADVLAPTAFRELQNGARFEVLDHPLLEKRIQDRTRDIIVSTVLSPTSHWVLAEHGIGDSAVLPGTASIEMIHSAFQATVGAEAVEISEVVFIGPVTIAGQREMRVMLVADGDGYDVTVATAPVQLGSRDWTEHVKARVRGLAAEPAPAHDLDEIMKRCTELSFRPEEFTSIGNVVRYGPHWGNTEEVFVGQGEEIGRLRLDPQFAGECTEYTLHPSLFDDAVSNSQYLPIPVARGDRYLPFSYSRIIIRGPLPPTFYTHVRHLDAVEGEIIGSDITLIGDDGTELVRVEGYSMRRVDAESLHTTVQEAPAGQVTGVSLEANRTESLDLGIAPDDGLAVLVSVLDAQYPGHVIVCPEGLGNYLRKLERLTSDRLVEELVDIQISTGQTMERLLDNPYVEPETDVQRTLATLWAQALGLHQVGIEDDFFELGGNSLVAVQLGARIRRVFDVEMPLAALFEQPTVQTLAEMVEAALLDRVESMSDEHAAQLLTQPVGN
jgi:acyl transferase domain-containing protein/acyl carrier protein